MKLTSQTEYALLALVEIARSGNNEPLSAERISLAQDIPYKFLEQILIALRRAGLVKSTKGARGGYRLARSPDKIALAEVIRLFEGALAPTLSVSSFFYDATPIEREPSLVNVFKRVRDVVADVLENTKLSDVINSKKRGKK
jgi:Rrf2 family cysteine metabolism transcriptional repressor